ncbi:MULTISPECIES: glycoside hydrolase family 3 N-terminal domain-containing protein [unclassified Agarivorans]|uniref:glycoside hydrolase family 3 N-terminal domain-containing protein n=2 Tax=Bacteria TaxID=2 RepID=UPI0026E1C06C|nr:MULTISPECIES: glycoside hydrolase family 3 N-terminal domain-containing protein [unclassified Agarivorans]MDO6686496.1 glycoside hydrolase family 3 N-terminal domain-containing protein [Agarivorans sp. 3_MG-2023]MDO6715314.1 glycoside hydrolase family 3 N-terminal domain-containing protein [Agarivorans sp. 2_MG-2023]
MSQPYTNPSLSTAERVENLLSLMTVEEKVGQMLQLPANMPENLGKLEDWNVGSYLHCTGNVVAELQARAEKTRLGIPLIFGIDAIHGHCFENNGTVFPTQLALSSAWSKQLSQSMAHVTAVETRACGLHWTFSPVLCVGRDSRWGRVNETFGEDPWLIGELAAAAVYGYQGDTLASTDTILACAKHYVAYGEATGGRDAYEAEVSPRKLLSLFLPPFEKAVKEAKVATLMVGYQAIDGVPCSANSWLLREVPKNQWGMDGFIVTDWDNIGSLHDKQRVAVDLRHAAKIAVESGNDMIMTTPSFYQHAIDLVADGELDIAFINDAVSRILKYKFELGLFDEHRYTDLSKKDQILGNPAHWHEALEASRQSLTLLKNEGVLPLSSDNKPKILLCGANADDVVAQLGDWSFGSMQAGAADDSYHQKDAITLRQGLQAEADAGRCELNYVRGAAPAEPDFEEILAAADAASNSDIVVACVGDTLSQHGEFHDRADLDLSGHQQAMLEAVKATGKPLIVVFMASKPLTIGWVKQHADAIVCAFNPGAKGGQALSELLFGELNPSGKLTISFPEHVGQSPVYYNKYEGWHARLSERTNNQERYIDMPALPLFSFGEGKSYSEFSYSDLSVANPQLPASDDLAKGEALKVSVNISNVSQRTGLEIAQLYIHDSAASVTVPVLQLRGFERVELAAGETRRVEFSVPYSDLALINAKLEKVVEPGEFKVFVGASSKADDLLSANFRVE